MPASRLRPWTARLAGILVVLACCAFAGAETDEVVEWNERGLAHSQAGRFADAVEAFERALDLLPEDATLRRNLALAKGNLGVQRIEEDRLVEAEELTREALELDPENAGFLLNLATCLHRRGFPHRARIYVLEAAELAPQDPRVAARLGEVHYAQGRVAEAVEAWERAVEGGGGDETLRTRLHHARRAAAVEARLHEQVSGSFRILYDLERHGVVASRVLRALSQARLELAAKLEQPGPDEIRIVLTDFREFRETTGAQRWAVGLYDGQIRLPVHEDGKGLENLLARARHEYVHAALASLGRRVPSWLNEGLAQTAEGRRALDARAAVRRSPAVPLAQLGESFVGTRNTGTARRLYDTSLAFVDWLSDGERAGAFRAMIRRLFAGDDLATALDVAYDAELEDLYEAFQAGVPR